MQVNININDLVSLPKDCRVADTESPPDLVLKSFYITIINRIEALDFIHGWFAPLDLILFSLVRNSKPGHGSV